jgi:hypothetical protein
MRGFVPGNLTAKSGIRREFNGLCPYRWKARHSSFRICIRWNGSDAGVSQLLVSCTI